MGRSLRRSNLFHQILVQHVPCNSFYSQLPAQESNHRRRSLRSPDGCLRRSTNFILRCRIRYLECPITLVLDPSAVMEAWEEEEVGVAVEVEVAGTEGEGGNQCTVRSAWQASVAA